MVGWVVVRPVMGDIVATNPIPLEKRSIARGMIRASRFFLPEE